MAMRWKDYTTQGTQLKREQLYREIGKVQDEKLRSNLEHTYYKLFAFLDDDVTAFARDQRRDARSDLMLQRSSQ